MTYRQKFLRKFQWGRDFTARILRLYRIQNQIRYMERTRKLQSMTQTSKGVRSYVVNTYKLAKLMTRFNKLKFWFQPNKYPKTDK